MKNIDDLVRDIKRARAALKRKRIRAEIAERGFRMQSTELTSLLETFELMTGQTYADFAREQRRQMPSKKPVVITDEPPF